MRIIFFLLVSLALLCADDRFHIDTDKLGLSKPQTKELKQLLKKLRQESKELHKDIDKIADEKKRLIASQSFSASEYQKLEEKECALKVKLKVSFWESVNKILNPRQREELYDMYEEDD